MRQAMGAWNQKNRWGVETVQKLEEGQFEIMRGEDSLV